MVRSIVAGGLVSLALVVAGCGGSSSSGGSTGTGSVTSAAKPSGASTGVARARAIVDRLSRPQGSLAVAALPKAPPRGLRIDVQTCALQVCETTTNQVKVAAEKLGWRVKMFTIQPTPQAYVQAWTQMMQDPPDMIADTAIFPHQIITKQLAEAKAKNVKIIDMAAGGLPLPSGLTASVAGAASFYADAQFMADVVAADAGGRATVLVPQVAAFAAEWKPMNDGLRSELAKTCGCKMETTTVDTSGPAGQVQGAIINYLKRNTDVKYLAALTPSLLTGLPQALKAAGLDVKIVSRQPQSLDMQYLKANLEIGNVLGENGAAGWRVIDAFARESVGIKPAFDVAGYHAILTPRNVQGTKVPGVPGVPSSYLEAWRVTQ